MSSVHDSDRPLVLVADDDEDIRALVSFRLERAGYEVVEARDGEEALRVLGDPSQRVNLIVSDLVMPRAGGRDVALAAARLRPGVPTVLMSGYTEDATLRRGALPPGAIFLSKPFSPGQLVECVEDALRPAAQAGDSR